MTGNAPGQRPRARIPVGLLVLVLLPLILMPIAAVFVFALKGGPAAFWKALTNEDAQFLENRKFQRTEICAIYRVPPHKVMDLGGASYANMEVSEQAYINDALLPDAEQIAVRVGSRLPALVPAFARPGPRSPQKLLPEPAVDVAGFEAVVVDQSNYNKRPGYNPADDLKALEQLWLDKLSPFDERGYNARPKGAA